MTDARTLTHGLGGKWFGRYGTANCPAHPNTRTPALSLSDGEAGLLAYCHAGCDFASVVAALRGMGLLEGSGAFVAPDPAVAAARRAAERVAAEKRAAQARALWREARPVRGTPAETYLRGRGITCPLPETLRFAPSAGTRRPGAVRRWSRGWRARRLRGASHLSARRWLGQGRSRPATGPCSGPSWGGACRLMEGPGPLVVAEGIETALSLASGLLRAPATVWAALSTSGSAGLRLPTAPGRLTVAADGDEGAPPAHALAERAHGLGWRVSLLPAPGRP